MLTDSVVQEFGQGTAGTAGLLSRMSGGLESEFQALESSGDNFPHTSRAWVGMTQG